MEAVSTLLSQVLVAVTLEVDNEAQAAIPHRTSSFGGAGGPWLVSWTMYANLLPRIPPAGIDRAEVADLCAVSNPGGLLRWGYLAETGGVLRLTTAGQRACEVWASMPAEVERRWSERVGDGLRPALTAVHERLSVPALDAMPVVPQRLRADAAAAACDRGDRSDSLLALLSRVLLAFTLEYESRTPRSLTVAANAFRVIGTGGRPTREIPVAAGISPEATRGMLGLLTYAEVVAVTGRGSSRRADLTDRGRRMLLGHHRRLVEVEQWLGDLADVADLRRELEAVLDSPALAPALTPYDGTWRLLGPYRRRTERLLEDPRGGLPHHPVVLHRGAFPDGA